MRKASTELPEQGIQAPSPAPDLIPAEIINRGLTLGLVQQTGALQVSPVPRCAKPKLPPGNCEGSGVSDKKVVESRKINLSIRKHGRVCPPFGMQDLAAEAKTMLSSLQGENVPNGYRRRVAAIGNVRGSDGSTTLVAGKQNQRQSRILACGRALNSKRTVFHRFLRQFVVPDEIMAEPYFVHGGWAEGVDLLQRKQAVINRYLCAEAG